MPYNPDVHHRRSIRLKGWDYASANLTHTPSPLWRGEHFTFELDFSGECSRRPHSRAKFAAKCVAALTAAAGVETRRDGRTETAEGISALSGIPMFRVSGGWGEISGRGQCYALLWRVPTLSMAADVEAGRNAEGWKLEHAFSGRTAMRQIGNKSALGCILYTAKSLILFRRYWGPRFCSMSTYRILVVDDSIEMRDFLSSTILSDDSFIVQEAANGSGGMRLALANPFDLIITDYAMPEMNGLEMVKRLRDAGHSTPVILMTAEGSEEIAVQALRMGVADYFIKPFDPFEMQEAIDHTLARAVTIGGRSPLASWIDRTVDPIMILDGGGHVLYANSASSLVLDNIPPDGNVLGLPLGEITSNGSLLDLCEMGADGFVNGEVPTADGYTFNAHVSSLSKSGIVITMHDVTTMKQAMQRKDEFVMTVAHDLRSPLTAILSFVDLLPRFGPLSERQISFIGKAKEAVGSISALLTDLLELSKIEASIDRPPQPVDIGHVVTTTVEMLRHRLERKHQAITITPSTSELHVLGNSIRLGQVFSNLIENASKYSADEAKIEVVLETQGDQVVCHVKDNGIGIPIEEQQHIFDRFYRVSGVAGDYDGTGLGLNIVKSIVEAHGGRVWVESTPGKGSTFTVVLPTHAPAA
jgi:signal transduction histidine kinase